ncbi:MAG: pyridoxamine 5'-phosphate oxidase family protein [Dokdonella sp.]
MKRTARSKVIRVRQRAHYDATSIHAVFDAAWLAHVSFANDGQPFVIPMLYVRDGADLLLHGSIASRLLKTVGTGIDACVCVTVVDGLVLARSHFDHSVNYRSVVAFGNALPITDLDAKRAALARFVEAIIPGRAIESRAPDAQELAATSVLRFTIAEASAKIRNGGPKDNPADVNLPIWAGTVPLQPHYGAPIAADDLPAGLSGPNSVPPSVRRLIASNATE